ncbi:MAG: sugar ABC transporter substrate-binding protein [Alphaproteobacteria bacterium]|nr:MAG: sugar ABC transporter substrate-binding protein [Alphaproteobacteria bacterium]
MIREGMIKKGALALSLLAAIFVSACASKYPDAPTHQPIEQSNDDYKIGPGDTLQVFVWRNQDLSTTVPVRPDGRISIPLIEDILAAGKSPTQLATEMEETLKTYIQDPQVTIIVTGFTGSFSQQIRIVGQATRPQALPYRKGMTVLDAMIEVGGLTDYADGNRAVIIRKMGEEEQVYRVRLADLLRSGDVGANVDLHPGDVLIIPESRF